MQNTYFNFMINVYFERISKLKRLFSKYYRINPLRCKSLLFITYKHATNENDINVLLLHFSFLFADIFFSHPIHLL